MRYYSFSDRVEIVLADRNHAPTTDFIILEEKALSGGGGEGINHLIPTCNMIVT